MNFELTEIEIQFLTLLRNFDFLRSYGYFIKELVLYGRETYLIYENNNIKQSIYIEWAPINVLKIKLVKKSLFRGGEFDIKDILNFFDEGISIKDPPIYINMLEVIELNAKFIQKHLMPIIKGELWIDKLIKQKNKYLC